MEWLITVEDVSPRDRTGVEGFIERMDRELRGSGTPIEGFRFLNSSAEMFRYTQEIEKEVRASPAGARLYTGFQTAEKFLAESEKYRRLLRAGVKVAAFGQGTMPETPDGLEHVWTPLEPDTHALENQWFLVSPAPSPIAFIAWETSQEQLFGEGGLTAPGKQFKGFATNDYRVTHAVIGHLESVRARAAESYPHTTEAKAKRILAVTRMDDAPEYASLRSHATAMAAPNGGAVVLFEMSAASYLVSPYPEENRQQWIRTLREPELRRLGRSPLAKQLCAIRSQGADAEAILPTTHGFKHLAEWADREDVDMIMVPQSLVSPSLFDRLRRYSLNILLEHTGRPVTIVEPSGSTWQVQARRPAATMSCPLPEKVLR